MPNLAICFPTAMRLRNIFKMRAKYPVELFMLMCLVFVICIHSKSAETFPSKRNVDSKHNETTNGGNGKGDKGSRQGGSTGKRGKYQIPFIVHQLWNTKDVPRPVLPYIDTWMTQHPHWQYWFWTKESQERFLQQRYPTYLPLYQGYELDIQRADMIRFLILYEFGGVYADLDVEVLRPLDTIVTRHPCIVAAEPEEIATVFFNTNHSFITSNALFACRPKHPFLRTVLDELYKTRNETDVMKSTGPLIIDAIVKGFISSGERSQQDQLYIAPSQYFLPSFGDIHVKIIKKKCGDVFRKPRLCGARSLQALDYKRLSVCKLLEKTDFTKHPTKESYTDHHWVGSWVPKTGWVDAHKNDANKMAADHTSIDDWFPKLKEDSGVLKRL